MNYSLNSCSPTTTCVMSALIFKEYFRLINSSQKPKARIIACLTLSSEEQFLLTRADINDTLSNFTRSTLPLKHTEAEWWRMTAPCGPSPLVEEACAPQMPLGHLITSFAIMEEENLAGSFLLSGGESNLLHQNQSSTNLVDIVHNIHSLDRNVHNTSRDRNGKARHTPLTLPQKQWLAAEWEAVWSFWNREA